MDTYRGWVAVLSTADEQWGLVTKQQVDDAGVAWSTLARQVRRGSVERVAHGVYRIRGAGDVDHLELRAAWLQLSPATAVWERAPSDGVVSHRAATALYGLGELPADVHEFTLPTRKQSRRHDVRLHRAQIGDTDWTTRSGLPVTRPHRIATDLLKEREDPEALGHILADALRAGYDQPAAIAHAIAPFASTYSLTRNDGIEMLRWLLGLTGDPDRDAWLTDAATSDRGRVA